MSGNSTIMIVVGLSLMLVGVIVTISGIVALIRANKTKNWPAADGQVNEAHIEERRTNYTVNHQRRTRLTYEPVVSYTYQVGGSTYTGHKIQEIPSSYDQGKAEGVAAGYPAGGAVKVYYDPQKPEKAVLVPGGGGGGIALIIGGIIMGGIGLLLVVLTFLF